MINASRSFAETRRRSLSSDVSQEPLLLWLMWKSNLITRVFLSFFVTMPAPINRKDRNDIAKQVLMSWDLCKRSEQRADELNKPYSRYIRDLIIDDLKRAQTERLSQQTQANSSVNPVEILHSLNGLLEKNPDLLRVLEQLNKKS